MFHLTKNRLQIRGKRRGPRIGDEDQITWNTKPLNNITHVFVPTGNIISQETTCLKVLITHHDCLPGTSLPNHPCTYTLRDKFWHQNHVWVIDSLNGWRTVLRTVAVIHKKFLSQSLKAGLLEEWAFPQIQSLVGIRIMSSNNCYDSHKHLSLAYTRIFIFLFQFTRLVAMPTFTWHHLFLLFSLAPYGNGSVKHVTRCGRNGRTVFVIFVI